LGIYTTFGSTLGLFYRMRFWKAPNTKDAYRLSIVSLVCTVVAAIVGLILYKVNTHRCLFVSFSLCTIVNASNPINSHLCIRIFVVIALSQHRTLDLRCVSPLL
jgi:hypothetical protein